MEKRKFIVCEEIKGVRVVQAYCSDLERAMSAAHELSDAPTRRESRVLVLDNASTNTPIAGCEVVLDYGLRPAIRPAAA